MVLNFFVDWILFSCGGFALLMPNDTPGLIRVIGFGALAAIATSTAV